MAKPATSDTPTAKKRGGLAAATRRRRARRTEARRSNPAGGEAMALLQSVGVGVGAYTATRFAQRMVWTIVKKKRPRWARHAHAAVGLLAFAGAYFAGKRVKAMQPYYEPVLMGTGVAAVQGVVSAFVPKYAWLMNDCRPEDALPAAAAEQQQLPSSTGDQSFDLLEQQLAEYEQGHSQKRSRQPVAAALQTAAAATGETGIDESLLEELGDGENIDDLYGGVFEDPTLAN